MKIALLLVVLVSIVTQQTVWAASRSVILERGEFISMLVHVESQKKSLMLANEQIKLFVKSSEQKDKVIEIQKSQIDELRGLVDKYELLDASNRDLESALNKKIDELERGHEVYIAVTATSILVAVVAVLFAFLK